jgi:microcystin-dependent protein
MVNPFVGEIVLYAFNFVPQGWAACAGQLMAIGQEISLFTLIGNRFGGNGETDFALPDYRSIAPTGLQYCIALTGIVPTPGADSRPQGLGEIASLPYSFAPYTWIDCNGQLLEIAENESLFHVIGTKFGGDGQSTFGLPNLVSTPPTAVQFPGAPPPTTSQYFIATAGGAVPVDPFLAEVRLFPFEAAPAGWETCSGQLLPINQNQALFSLLGFTFGGDGRINFALPDLRDLHLPSGLQYCIAIGGTFPSRSMQVQETETETETSPREEIRLPGEEGNERILIEPE